MPLDMRGFACLAVAVIGALLAGCRSGPSPPTSTEVPAAVPTDWPTVEEGAKESVFIDKVEVPAKLPSGAQAMMERNGFVVLGDVEASNLKDAYFAVMPNFITSDAVLYVFHCLFRGGLSIYEKQNLAPLCDRLVSAGLTEAQKQYRALTDHRLLAEPARRNVIFFAVAKAVLSGECPLQEREEVEEIVGKINDSDEAGFYPHEDFTTYKPRSVYAEDEALARYFRAMKWVSRVILPIIPGSNDEEPDASIKLRQAYLLGTILREETVRQPWEKLYGEISFFIAEPDSFTPVRFYEVARRIPGWPSDAWVAAVRKEFGKSDYPESKIVPVPQGNPGDAPRKYVQFIGERYIPDGQIHQEACFPYVYERTVPKGLDIGYTLFDSSRAKVHLADEMAKYRDLEPALGRLHAIFSTYASEKEPTSIYAGWIGAVRDVLHPPASRHIPEFFSSDPWRDKSLTTALASWTHLRHDFVLYAKEPAIPASEGMETLVEPVPDAYERLELLARKLKERGFPGMDSFEELCRVLKEVSRCELAGEDWRKSDAVAGSHSWVDSFAQWLLTNFSTHVPVEQPSVVVDVCTDSNPPNRVLHEATGPLNLIVVPGEWGEIRGWVLSYYEFTVDNFTRLTDQEWEERVSHGKHRAARPEWVKSYMYER